MNAGTFREKMTIVTMNNRAVANNIRRSSVINWVALKQRSSSYGSPDLSLSVGASLVVFCWCSSDRLAFNLSRRCTQSKILPGEWAWWILLLDLRCCCCWTCDGCCCCWWLSPKVVVVVLVVPQSVVVVIEIRDVAGCCTGCRETPDELRLCPSIGPILAQMIAEWGFQVAASRRVIGSHELECQDYEQDSNGRISCYRRLSHDQL